MEELSDLEISIMELHEIIPINWGFYEANEEDTEYDFVVINLIGREKTYIYDVIEQIFLQDVYTEIGISEDKIFLSIVPLAERNIWID